MASLIRCLRMGATKDMFNWPQYLVTEAALVLATSLTMIQDSIGRLPFWKESGSILIIPEASNALLEILRTSKSPHSSAFEITKHGRSLKRGLSAMGN